MQMEVIFFNLWKLEGFYNLGDKNVVVQILLKNY